jgi:DNA-binding NarL/FixJ family response regulator
MIRLALADDHPLVLEGLAHLFEQEPDLEVVARCSNGEAALRALRDQRPDILIIDLSMPGLSGVDVLRRMAEEGAVTRVILLTGDVGEEDLLEAIRLGVRGVLLKEAAPDLLVRSVRAVHAGERRLEGGLASRALERLLAREVDRQQAGTAPSRREAELIRLVSQGLRNKEIAARLGITEGTVKTHLHRLYEKLGVTSRVELVNCARCKGW